MTTVLSREVVTELQTLMFGDAPFDREMKANISRWFQQSIGFGVGHKAEVFFGGFVQPYAGPCGLHAVLNAFTLCELLFGVSEYDLSMKPDQVLQSIRSLDDMSKTQIDDVFAMVALVGALAFSIWQAGNGRTAVVVFFVQPSLRMTTLNSYDDVFHFVFENSVHFTSNMGMMNFVYSLLMSRGLEQVKADMGGRYGINCLVQDHGTCSQDLLNLATIGLAIPSVHNDNAGNESFGVGLPRRSVVGFISNYAAAGVGSHYLNPMVPFWLISGEGHVTLLLSDDPLVIRELSHVHNAFPSVRRSESTDSSHSLSFSPYSPSPAISGPQITNIENQTLSTHIINPIRLYHWNGLSLPNEDPQFTPIDLLDHASVLDHPFNAFNFRGGIGRDCARINADSQLCRTATTAIMNILKLFFRRTKGRLLISIKLYLPLCVAINQLSFSISLQNTVYRIGHLTPLCYIKILCFLPRE